MTQAITPSTITITVAPAASGIGWSHGMAWQVSLPSISLLRPGMHGRTAAPRMRAGRRWKLLGHDGIEQIRLDGPIGERRDVPALAGKRRVALPVQHGSCLPRVGNPLREGFLRNGTQEELHTG